MHPANTTLVICRCNPMPCVSFNKNPNLEFIAHYAMIAIFLEVTWISVNK